MSLIETPRSLIIQGGKATLDPIALSGFGVLSCLLFLAKRLRVECPVLNGSCVCFTLFLNSHFYVHPCVMYSVLQMKSPASGPPCEKAGRVYPTQGLQAKGMKIRLKFSPVCWWNQVLSWDCICPDGAGFFFFCSFPKVSIRLAVASLMVSLVQSQPLLPDLILKNLDLLKDNK